MRTHTCCKRTASQPASQPGETQASTQQARNRAKVERVTSELNFSMCVDFKERKGATERE